MHPWVEVGEKRQLTSESPARGMKNEKGKENGKITGFAFIFEHRKWNRGHNGLHQLGQPVAPSILFPVFKSEGKPGTVHVDSLPHRKWKETKQQPGTAGPGNMLGC